MQTMNRVFGTIGLTLFALSAFGQTAEQRGSCEREYSPRSGQAGKDVIWVPTPDELVTSMLKLASVTADDIVYDLGAGDGKIAIAAAKQFGARAVGVEYNPDMAKFAQCLANAAGVADKVKIVQGDIFETDFSTATVVTLYLLTELNLKLRPTLLKMRPGTRVVSHSFLMGDWHPDERIDDEGYDRAYLWIIPAQLAGTWELRADNRPPLTLKLTQKYQAVEGEVIDGNQEAPIRNATLRGDELTFNYVGRNNLVAVKAKISNDQLNAAITDGPTTITYQGRRR